MSEAEITFLKKRMERLEENLTDLLGQAATVKDLLVDMNYRVHTMSEELLRIRCRLTEKEPN